jgi:signal transduction histidine kinase
MKLISKRWHALPAAWRLTAAYTLIILAICLLFSFSLYNTSVRQLDESYRANYSHLQGFNGFFRLDQPFDIEGELEKAHGQLKWRLVYLNSIIILVGAGASYLLARRTLRPIEEALEAQSRFTGDASHELRTPLAAMQTENEVALRDERLTLAEARMQLQSNLEEIAKLRALSDGLLRLAADRRSSQPPLAPVNLANVARDAAASLEPLAKEKNISIVADMPDELDVRGDAVALRELIIILIDNAIKYSAKDTRVTLSARRHGHSATLSVADEGAGINSADLAHIFDRFYRADTARHHSGAGGYGLGLSIARSIVDVHSGTITAANRPDRGAIFTVRLPANRES